MGGCKLVLKLSGLTESRMFIMHLKVLRTDIWSSLADSAAHGYDTLQLYS